MANELIGAGQDTARPAPKTNTITCGDCFDILPLLSDKSVDYSFTSPPYNRKRNDKYAEYTDIIADYFNFLTSSIDLMLYKTKKICFINLQANYYNRADVYKIIGEYSNIIQDIIIWEKTNPMTNGNKSNGRYSMTNAVEYFIAMGGCRLQPKKTYTKNIVKSSVAIMGKSHKASMHQNISDWFIDMFTDVGDIILDPFLGTGTTAVSCVKQGRNFIGIEQSKEYCRIAEERIHALKSPAQDTMDLPYCTQQPQGSKPEA